MGEVWEEEGRLSEVGFLCRAELAGNVFPNELVHTGALLPVLLLPSAVPLFLTSFPPWEWVCFPQLVLISAASSPHSWTNAGMKLFWCFYAKMEQQTKEHLQMAAAIGKTLLASIQGFL